MPACTPPHADAFTPYVYAYNYATTRSSPRRRRRAARCPNQQYASHASRVFGLRHRGAALISRGLPLAVLLAFAAVWARRHLMFAGFCSPPAR